MAPLLPMSLSGENLGQRHRELNSQVKQAATGQLPFEDFEALPECSPVDRLFKIDLANKLQNVHYILKNLKDDDMLYVSRALKCKWLLERRDIINPKYLESVLFPEMVMPAISKLKHWLYINLRDPFMCHQFYVFYKQSSFDLAVKFLSHCDDEFISNEFPNILSKITPHHLKVLAEKNPKLVKVYFDALATDNKLVQRYLKEETAFYNSIKCVLKSEPNIYLNIIEKYNSLSAQSKLSATATDYIMRFHKSRFMIKSELYVVYLLDIPTVAHRLSVEECQEVVLKLAQAEYLSWWFSYDKVEPLVKRVNHDSRTAFKKRVFVDKDIGECVTEWPYTLPASPVFNDPTSEIHVFHDQAYEPVYKMRHLFKERDMIQLCGGEFKSSIMNKCGMQSIRMCAMACSSTLCPIKSELQKLFDEFRFTGFERTLHELKERVGSASSADRRRDMLLVLVSKSGGRADSVRALLQLALRLRNEPVHERAAVVRSLVKRASAWRLPHDVWGMLLEYAQGLGLDGTKPEADCHEGLHAVVLRQLITTGDCDPAVRAAFLDNFSTFNEYKLIASERAKACTGLQRILMEAAIHAEPEVAVRYLNQLLDVLEKYRIPIVSSPVISTVATLAERDSAAAKQLLERLYKARVGRRELLRKYLEFQHNDAALLNVLRHDPQAITTDWLVKILVDRNTQANQFFLKLAVYFNETGGIAEQVRQALQAKVSQEPDVKLARPLATLAGSDMISLWREHDVIGDAHYKLTAALRANMHRARPAPDALALGWRKAGMKAVAWRATRCRPAQVTQVAQMLLASRDKRTVRLALLLAQRTECAVDIFTTAVTIRPLAALRAALLYYRSLGDAADLGVLDVVKHLISSVDLTPCEGVRHILRQVTWVPTVLRPDYCAMLYLALDKISDRNKDYVLRDLMTRLPEVNDDLLEKVLLRMLDKMSAEEPESYPALVIRYLMLSKTIYKQKTRFEQILQPFLAKLDTHRDTEDPSRHSFFSQNLDQIMSSLHYNSAFFDIKYQHCLPVIEAILIWMEKFLPKESHFKQYVTIHTAMLYYKAVRQSMKQRPEVFQDPVKKMYEGVEIVGFTFGRYVVKELAELMSKYFDSVIELYREAFVDYLREYFRFGSSRDKFIAAVTKGILSDSVGPEGRLAVHVLQHNEYYSSSALDKEIKELLLKSDNKEIQFFLHAELYS